MRFNGAGGDEQVDLSANGNRLRFFRTQGAITMDTAGVERVDFNALGGADLVTVNDLTGTDVKTVNADLAGALGGNTGDAQTDQVIVSGGDGDDVIDGNGGADTGLLGAGNGTFIWDPGDGSDVVEGQDGADDGADTLLFNGAAGAENFDLSANGNRVRFFRAQGAIPMDLNEVEFIDVQALGGADSAVVNDTTGTDLKRVAFDLEGAVGGGAGDGAADSITVNGTDNPDDIQVTENEGGVLVNGVPPTVQIDHSEAANDTLLVNTLGGDDNVAIDPEVAALIQTIVDLG